LDVRWINPFVLATQRVFKLMGGVEVISQPAIAQAKADMQNTDVSAVISIEANSRGVIVLRFPGSIIMPLASAMTGTSVSLDDTHDAIAELANMVTGNARRSLANPLVKVSVPKIISGSWPVGAGGSLTPWLVVPFACALGKFDLMLHMADAKATSHPVDEMAAVAEISMPLSNTPQHEATAV